MNHTNLFYILLGIVLLTSIVFAAPPEITQSSYDPSPAVPGSTITVLVQLENKTQFPQKGVTVHVENQYPFTVKTSDSEPNPRIVGNMDNFAKALAQYTVYIDPTAENKTYPLPVTVTTQDDQGGKKTEIPIVVGGKEPVVKVVSLLEEKLLPGEQKDITLELQNVGTGPAYDITVEMPEDRTVTATGTVVGRDITPLGAALAYVSSLNPGEKKSTTLRVSVSSTAAIKTYTQPITVAYRDASGTRISDTSYIGLDVFGNADLDATLKENGLIAGQKGDVTIEIFNKGLGKAEFVLVELSTPDGTIEKPKQFIGSLGPNDVDTVKSAVTFTSGGNHTITATVNYMDADSNTKTVAIAVPVNASAATGEGPNLLFILIVLIVAGFLVWNFVLKKRNKK